MDAELMTWATPLLDYLASVPAYLLDANKRLYLDYLLGAALLAVLVWAVQRFAPRSAPQEAPRLSWRQWLRRGFSTQYLWHPSARLDYQLFLLNPVLTGLVSGSLVVGVIPVALAVSNSLHQHLGHPSPGWSPWLVTALYTSALFVADDFTRFYLHKLMHRVPWLWSIHTLHHSAEVLTPITVYRIHPIESLLYANRMLATQGLVLGVFFFGFGMRLSAWDIAGANLFTYLFNLFGANLRHSHVRLSYGRWLERWLISPAQHQIHHSIHPQHRDRNFGAFLAIWDRLSGTLTTSPGEPIDQFGLGPNRAHRHLGDAYWRPVRDSIARLLTPFNPMARRPSTPPPHRQPPVV